MTDFLFPLLGGVLLTLAGQQHRWLAAWMLGPDELDLRTWRGHRPSMRQRCHLRLVDQPGVFDQDAR